MQTQFNYTIQKTTTMHLPVLNLEELIAWKTEIFNPLLPSQFSHQALEHKYRERHCAKQEMDRAQQSVLYHESSASNQQFIT